MTSQIEKNKILDDFIKKSIANRMDSVASRLNARLINTVNDDADNKKNMKTLRQSGKLSRTQPEKDNDELKNVKKAVKALVTDLRFPQEHQNVYRDFLKIRDSYNEELPSLGHEYQSGFYKIMAEFRKIVESAFKKIDQTKYPRNSEQAYSIMESLDEFLKNKVFTDESLGEMAVRMKFDKKLSKKTLDYIYDTVATELTSKLANKTFTEQAEEVVEMFPMLTNSDALKVADMYGHASRIKINIEGLDEDSDIEDQEADDLKVTVDDRSEGEFQDDKTLANLEEEAAMIDKAVKDVEMDMDFVTGAEEIKLKEKLQRLYARRDTNAEKISKREVFLAQKAEEAEEGEDAVAGAEEGEEAVAEDTEKAVLIREYETIFDELKRADDKIGAEENEEERRKQQEQINVLVAERDEILRKIRIIDPTFGGAPEGKEEEAGAGAGAGAGDKAPVVAPVVAPKKETATEIALRKKLEKETFELDARKRRLEIENTKLINTMRTVIDNSESLSARIRKAGVDKSLAANVYTAFKAYLKTHNIVMAGSDDTPRLSAIFNSLKSSYKKKELKGSGLLVKKLKEHPRKADDFSIGVQNTVKLLAFDNKFDSDLIRGSSSLRSMVNSSDYDMFEKIYENADMQTAVKEVTKRMQVVVKRLMKAKEVYIMDIKAGTDNDLDYKDVPTIHGKKISNYKPQEIKNFLIRVLSRNLITKAQFNEGIDLLKPRLSLECFYELSEYLRKLKTIRWDPLDFLKGFKTLSAGRIKKLSDAVQDKGLIKIDVNAIAAGRLVEFSNIYEFWSKNGPINALETDYVKSVKSEILMLHTFGKYMKMNKRILLIARANKNQKMVENLVELFNSSLGSLNKIRGDLESILAMLEKYPNNLPWGTIIEELDIMRERFAVIYEVQGFKADDINQGIDDMVRYKNTASGRKLMTESIETIIDYLSKVLNGYALKFNREPKIGLEPLPKIYYE